MFQYIGLAGIMPNLLLILVISTAFMRGRMSGLLVGFFAGLLVDLMSGTLVGLCTLFYLVIGYFTGFSHRYYDRDDYTIPVILVAIGDLVYGFLYYVFNFLLRGRLNLFFYFRRIILPEMIYTIAVSILLYKLLHMINRRLDRKINEEA
jgi:rod shape-determining protein MreD